MRLVPLPLHQTVSYFGFWHPEFALNSTNRLVLEAYICCLTTPDDFNLRGPVDIIVLNYPLFAKSYGLVKDIITK